MTTLSRRSLFLSTLALIALAGAGCATAEPTQPTQPQEPTAPTSTITNPTPASPTSTSAVPASVLPVIDATWKTYNNTTIPFRFQYPTKGTYTPTWGVTFISTSDTHLKQGCYQGDTGSPRQDKGELQVGDTTFCIMRYEDAGAGQRYETDYYTGGLNGRVLLFTFSKHLTVGDNFDNVACHGQLVVASGTSCTPIDLGIYNAALDQIMKTYLHG